MPVRVFLVEDMKGLQAVIVDLLDSIGNSSVVKSVTTEAEANLWLAENPHGWDLAIVDLVLEQGTGLGVIDKGRHRPGSSRMIVFSDYVTPGIHRHCMALGADAAISKADLPGLIDYCTDLARLH